MIIRIVVLSLIILINLYPTETQNLDSLSQITSHNAHLLEKAASYGDGVFQGQPKWSPDGEYVAFASTHGAWVFPVDDFRNPIFLEHSYQVNDITWSPDGDALVTVTSNQNLVWRVDDWTIQDMSSSGADSVMYSPDGKHRVETTLEEAGNTGLDTVAIFTLHDNLTDNIVRLGNIEQIEAQWYTTGYAMFTEDSAYLVTVYSCYLFQYCEYNAYFTIWAMNDGLPTIVEELVLGHSVTALGGGRIAYFDDTGQIIILDIVSEQTSTVLISSVAQVAHVGNQLIVLTNDTNRNLIFVDLSNNEISWSIPFPDIWSFAVSPDGNQLAVATDRRIYQFDIINEDLIQRGDYMLCDANYSELIVSDTDLQASAFTCSSLVLLDDSETRCGNYNVDRTYFVGETYCDAKCVKLWEVDTLEAQFLVDVSPNDFAGEFNFYQDTSILAFEVSECLANMRCLASTVYLWDIGQENPILEISTAVVQQLLFAPSSEQNLLAVITLEDIMFIDAQNGEIVFRIESDGIMHSIFSDDGTQFYIRRFDDTVDVWQIRDAD
ncbi:MAG: hypothetical protein AAF846_15640 [Chloroflexota bacterium]